MDELQKFYDHIDDETEPEYTPVVSPYEARLLKNGGHPEYLFIVTKPFISKSEN